MSNPKSKSVKKGKAQVFRDARLNEDFSIQVRDDRFILTDASDEVGDEWVDVDMAMPDAIEMAEDIKQEENPLLDSVVAKIPKDEEKYTFKDGELKLHIESLSWNVYVFEKQADRVK